MSARAVALLVPLVVSCATRASAQGPSPTAQPPGVASTSPVPPTPSPPSARDALPGTIRVVGEGRVRVRPDVGIVHAGVEATGKTLAPTVADASGRMRKVLAAVAELGIPERDVATVRHDIQVERPWVDGRPRDITGYTVVDEVRITVRDLAKLGAVLDRVVAVGSNTVRGISFEKDDPRAEREKALAAAVATARGRAQAIADAAGATLAGIVSIEEATQGPVIPFAVTRKAELQAADGVPVSPGELEIRETVVTTVAIR
jgi:hypothetical protein